HARADDLDETARQRAEKGRDADVLREAAAADGRVGTLSADCGARQIDGLPAAVEDEAGCGPAGRDGHLAAAADDRVTGGPARQHGLRSPGQDGHIEADLPG